MRRKWRWLAVTIVSAGAAASLLVFPAGGVLASLRAALALPLVLVLPGYAITAAAFATRPLERAATLLFSLGLSLAVAILGGFVLDWTPWGLQARSWAALLTATTLGAGAITLVRRRKGASAVPREVGRHAGSRLRVGQALPLGLAALVLVAAVGVAIAGADRQPTAGFTQLWLLPAKGSDPEVIRLGLHNSESTATGYRLQVLAAGLVIAEWPSIELQPLQTWEITTTLTADQTDARTVEAILYRASDPGTIYRRVQLWRPR